ncbi:hypothetical protein [Candidatus Electronema sp. TJ]|uniref:hypothetical protein n=1 Tax=Candidatus Electronema sp. TJ TaxID=3401573 RepID=UPI003AA9B638
MQLTKQFLITEEGKFELSKIVSVKLREEEYLPMCVYPLLVPGVLLILFFHPLCSLSCLIPAAWFAVCHKRKVPCAVVTVCTAATTQVVKLSSKGQLQELEAAISKAKSDSKA